MAVAAPLFFFTAVVPACGWSLENNIGSQQLLDCFSTWISWIGYLQPIFEQVKVVPVMRWRYELHEIQMNFLIFLVTLSEEYVKYENNVYY